MTIDDESSVYVGGLPYDATEFYIRHVFSVYGTVVAVKIVNDHATRGKCYGFVTFTNPRSAYHAISDMNGRTILGRVVRVNEVTTRAGRSNFGRDHSRRSEWYRNRDSERDHDRDREQYQDRYSYRSGERIYEHKDHDKEDLCVDFQLCSTNSNYQHGRGISSDSSDDYSQMKKELERSIQSREELKNEISLLDKKVVERQQIVSDLQKNSKSLEDALVAAKKLSSRRKTQLTKLHKCFLQVKEYREKLKSSEQELQSLVDSAMLEIEDDVAEQGGSWANGVA